MDRQFKISEIRNKLAAGTVSIGSWMQIPDPNVAELMGSYNFDWICVDLEHGSFSRQHLPDIFRAIELRGSLPIVRLADHSFEGCKSALDAGSGGVIVPMITSEQQLEAIRDACCWPPTGSRGVGFSRANLFGKNFSSYLEEAQNPIVVAMIEHIDAIDNLSKISKVVGLDAILIGPYDLSASLGVTGDFESEAFKSALLKICSIARQHKVPLGYHVVNPSKPELEEKVQQGYQFLAFSIDAVFLQSALNSNAI